MDMDMDMGCVLSFGAIPSNFILWTFRLNLCLAKEPPIVGCTTIILSLGQWTSVGSCSKLIIGNEHVTVYGYTYIWTVTLWIWTMLWTMYGTVWIWIMLWTVYGIVLDMISSMPWYAICEMHGMYLNMSLLHAEFAAHSLQPFFFRKIVDLFAGPLWLFLLYKYGWC